MFDGPEHEGYVALCRELRLERMFEDGDWFAEPPPAGTGAGRWNIGLYDGTVISDRWTDEELESMLRDGVWLPRLDQLLAMIREAGESGVTLAYDARFGHSAQIVRLRPIWCPSPEEAAARLWMAVQKVEP